VSITFYFSTFYFFNYPYSNLANTGIVLSALLYFLIFRNFAVTKMIRFSSAQGDHR